MKPIISLILFTCFTTTFYGQESKINIGLEGGPSLIQLSAGNSTYRPDFGFSGGLSLQYNFSKIFSIRTNLAYERKGSSFLETTTSNGSTTGSGNLATPWYITGTVKRHLNFDYLTLPILVRATFGRRANFFLNAGPFLGFLIKEKGVLDYKSYTYYSIDNTSKFKRLDAGVSIGLGFAVPIKTKFLLSFELRDNSGLNNIMDKPDDNWSPIVQTTSINLLVGVTYKLSAKNKETK